MKTTVLKMVAILAFSLFCYGCSQEQSEQAPASGSGGMVPEQAVDAAPEHLQTPVEEAGQEGVEEGRAVVNAVPEGAGSVEAPGQVVAGEMAEKAEKASAAVVAPAQDLAAETAVSAGVVESAVVQGPEVIDLQNKKGTVVFFHAEHSASFDCAICHGPGTPGKFDLNKDQAHKLCKDCHKEKGAGPTTKCVECHAEKAKKVVEGC